MEMLELQIQCFSVRYHKVTITGSQTEGLKSKIRAKQINNGFPSCYLMWTIKKVTYIPSNLLSSSPKIASLSPKIQGRLLSPPKLLSQ